MESNSASNLQQTESSCKEPEILHNPLNSKENEQINSSQNNTINIISNEEELKDFFSKNPDLKTYVKFTECHSEGLEKLKFMQNLTNMHMVIMNDITALIKQLEKEISAAISKIGKNSDSGSYHDEIKKKINQTIQVKNFDFDDKKDIFTIRQLVFVQRKIRMKEVKIIRSNIQIFNETKMQMERMKSIFNLHCLHQIKIQLDQEFFDINSRASKDQNLKRNLKSLEYLRRLENRLIQHIENIPRAQWSNNYGSTSNNYKKKFSIFMNELVQQAFLLMDWEISYCEPLDLEVSLSRCLFNPLSPFKNGIDKYIDSYFENETSTNFVQKLISYCFSFLDEYLSIKKKKVEYQSAALVLVFRAFFNRCYEMHPSFFANHDYSIIVNQIEKPNNSQNSDSDKNQTSSSEFNYNTSGNFMETLQITPVKKYEILDRIEQMKKSPAKKIPLPPALIQNRSQNAKIAAEVAERIKEYNEKRLKKDDNCQNDSESIFQPIHGYNVNEDETPIRDLFLSDPMFEKAAKTINLSIFCSNPLDALYEINKALALIHKGAINNQTENSSKSQSIARINEILEGKIHFKDTQNKEVSKNPPVFEVKDDLKQLLSFDDLFSLFFGTLLAADIPDLFDLAAFVGKFAPKICLSPPFEYAQANIEALVLHCINLEKDDN
ncbi:hypothetical protein M9Y10_012938 [Tritrichomonas musculus]|uniref:VPS9 domain-containing protein n=1 Tax=Tritrichomonas musculus TaxID=1915356 RepID=A0ABR2I5P2_9EUKA